MNRLAMYTVYKRPSDYPHSFVVRRWMVGDEGLQPDPLPYAVGPTLADVREVLPPGLYCMGREEGDEPQIVETWV